MSRATHPIALLLAATALVGASLALAPASANDDIEFETRAFDETGVDTVVFELTTEEGFTTLEDTHLELTATYPGDENRQRVSAVLGIVQETSTTSCPADGDDPCFQQMHAFTREDVAIATEPEGNGDVRLDTGPGVDLAAETGHDHGSYDAVDARIDFEHQTFPLDDDDHTWWSSYHVFVSVPGAEQMAGDLRLVARGNVSVTGQTLADAGFSHWIDDMRAAGAHTAMTNAYAGSSSLCGQGCGQVGVDVGEDERLYGAIGPSQNGFYTAHSDPTGNYCEGCMGPIPATFVGQWGAQWPGEVRSGTGVGAVSGAPPDAAIVTVPGTADGPVTFFVERYASLGPQDLVAAGFVGPQDPA